MGIIFFGLIELLLWYVSLAHIAIFFCQGWNEGSGSANMQCSISGIESLANLGYNLLTISSFTIGMVHIILFAVALSAFRYFLSKASEGMLPYVMSWISAIPVLLFGGLIIYAIYLIFFT
jgi:hypothetical protein